MAASTSIAIVADGQAEGEIHDSKASVIEFKPLHFEPWFMKDAGAKEHAVKWYETHLKRQPILGFHTTICVQEPG